MRACNAESGGCASTAMLKPSRTGKSHLTLGPAAAPVSPAPPVKLMVAVGDAVVVTDEADGRALGFVGSDVPHPRRRSARLSATNVPATTTTAFRFTLHLRGHSRIPRRATPGSIFVAR